MKIGIASFNKIIGGQNTFIENLSIWANQKKYSLFLYRPWFKAMDWVLINSSSRNIFWVIWQKFLGAKIILRLDNIDSGFHANTNLLKIKCRNCLIKIYGSIVADKIIYQSYFAKKIFNDFRLNNFSTVVLNPVCRVERENSNILDDKNIKILLVEGSFEDTQELAEFIKKLSSFSMIKKITLCGKLGPKLSKSLKSYKKIHMPGLVEKKIINMLFTEADIFLSVERNPACSNSIIEALSHGVPIVAFNTGSNAELIDDSVGCILDGKMFDIKNFEAAIHHIIQKKNIIFENCVKRVNDKHSLNKQFRKYFE